LENNYEESDSYNKKNSGIGIYNVKQRLKLLYQPKEYSLEIRKNKKVFSVILKLKLK
jgi:sensor histidine kinase YesM